MERKHFKRNIGVGLLVIFTFILAACGQRDISAVESAIEGHWTVIDAHVNDRPLEEVLQDLDEWLDIAPEDVTSNEQGTPQIEVDLYYNDGILALENAAGEVTTIPYIVQNTNEETHTLTLEYHIADEEVDITLSETIRFATEERASYTSHLNITDIAMMETASDDEVSDLERQLNELGAGFARQLLGALDFELNAVYVDDASAPNNTSE